MSDFIPNLLLRKLDALDVICRWACPPRALRNLSIGRMHVGHLQYHNESSEQYARMELEEYADALNYRALRLLEGERLTWRVRLGLLLWGLTVRLIDTGGKDTP